MCVSVPGKGCSPFCLLFPTNLSRSIEVFIESSLQKFCSSTGLYSVTVGSLMALIGMVRDWTSPGCSQGASGERGITFALCTALVSQLSAQSDVGKNEGPPCVLGTPPVTGTGWSGERQMTPTLHPHLASSCPETRDGRGGDPEHGVQALSHILDEPLYFKRSTYYGLLTLLPSI